MAAVTGEREVAVGLEAGLTPFARPQLAWSLPPPLAPGIIALGWIVYSSVTPWMSRFYGYPINLHSKQGPRRGTPRRKRITRLSLGRGASWRF